MTYKYDKPNSCLVQQPQMEKPAYYGCLEHERVHLSSKENSAIDTYRNHLASLLTLHLLSIPEGWVDGQVVVEGKDIEKQWQVYETRVSKWENVSESSFGNFPESHRRILAIPILPAQEGKEETPGTIKNVTPASLAKLFKQYSKYSFKLIGGESFGFTQEELEQIAGEAIEVCRQHYQAPSPSESNSNEGDADDWNEIDESNPKTYPKKNYGVLVFIPEEDGHITSGMWDISEKWVLLDEYRTVGEGEGMENCKVTHWMPLPKRPISNNTSP